MAENLRQAAAKWLDLPDGIWDNSAHLELFDNRRVLIDGGCEITECGEDVLVLTVGKTVFRFRGRDLCLTAFDAKSAVLEGRLSSVEFE